MKFKDFLNERTHRAIFLVDTPEKKAEKLASDIFDYLDDMDNNGLVTIEDVNVVEGDTDNDSIIHIVGSAQAPEKNWKTLVQNVQKKFKIEFERFA